jgi:hypothetical protein
LADLIHGQRERNLHHGRDPRRAHVSPERLGRAPRRRDERFPWCLPTVINGVKCVVVNSALREAEPMAWDFVVNFAKDNNLEHGEACLISEPRK